MGRSSGAYLAVGENRESGEAIDFPKGEQSYLSASGADSSL